LDVLITNAAAIRGANDWRTMMDLCVFHNSDCAAVLVAYGYVIVKGKKSFWRRNSNIQ
jgi:hypothetical protein